jgi:hypothetical protein
MLPLILLLQAAAAPAAPAPWTAIERPVPDSDVKAMVAYATSRDSSARMTVRCDRVKVPVVSIQIRTRTPMAAAADGAVAVTFDTAEPITAMWEFPGMAMLTSDPATVTAVTSGLVKARTVSVATGEGPTLLTEEFEGPASGDGIKAVLAACGYQLGVVPMPTTDKKTK